MPGHSAHKRTRNQEVVPMSKRMEALTSLMEVAGGVTIAVGVGLAWLPGGLVVAGVELVGLGYLLAPTPQGRRR